MCKKMLVTLSEIGFMLERTWAVSLTSCKDLITVLQMNSDISDKVPVLKRMLQWLKEKIWMEMLVLYSQQRMCQMMYIQILSACDYI